MPHTACGPAQVWRWSQQYRSQVLGEPLPEMSALAAWLGAHVPDQDADPSATRISHGDYRCRCPWPKEAAAVVKAGSMAEPCV